MGQRRGEEEEKEGEEWRGEEWRGGEVRKKIPRLCGREEESLSIFGQVLQDVVHGFSKAHRQTLVCFIKNQHLQQTLEQDQKIYGLYIICYETL